MNLNLEAYDWWGTKKNTWYRTLDSNSESLNSFVHIKNKNEENLFEAYLKVWVLYFYQSIVVTRVRGCARPCLSNCYLITVADCRLNSKRKNATEFIRQSLRIFVTLAMPNLNLFDVP